ncbi:MAG: acetoacetate--CoA ligase [Pirellula sp.]
MPKPNSSLLWKPKNSDVATSNMTRFAGVVTDKINGLEIRGSDWSSTYRAIHDWSVRVPDLFWKEIWDFCGVIGEPGSSILRKGESMLDWEWFGDFRLNYAENMLKPDRMHDPNFANQVALIDVRETGQTERWTRQELLRDVIALAGFFRSQGICPGDRIAAVVPNSGPSIIAYLACSAIGAIWSSCSPDFGIEAIRARFRQIQPKLLVTVAETTYNGKPIRPLERVIQLVDELPSVETVLVHGMAKSVDSTIANADGRNVAMKRSPLYLDWVHAMTASDAGFRTPRSHDDAFHWERFPFNHPLCILYSSGTTGAPKCIVHGAGGTLLQHLKEHQLHSNIRPGDAMLYYTTAGWMMWNWLISALGSEATIVAYDGSPVFPDEKHLWELCGSLGLTHFGASARYYAMLDKSGLEPKSISNLERLRCVLSTGSPLLPETFDWAYKAIGEDINLASISGGTDIVSCFVLGNPNLPVMRGEIQCKGLGMDVQVLDASGRTLIGEPGELCCGTPFPSMPIGFWNDPDKKLFQNAYFEKFPGFWCHGDWAIETERGTFVIYGRSDATLNPGGVRIGTAEIYQQLESFPQIAESIATALKVEGDEQIVLFVKLAETTTLSDELVDSIRLKLRTQCSPRHVPKHIAAAPDLPRTISGKLSEIAVRNAISGVALGNVEALANPESLTFFKAWRPS